MRSNIDCETTLLAQLVWNGMPHHLRLRYQHGYCKKKHHKKSEEHWVSWESLIHRKFYTKSVCVKAAFHHLQDIGDYSYRPHVHLRTIGTASENLGGCRKKENEVQLEHPLNTHILIATKGEKEIPSLNCRTLTTNLLSFNYSRMNKFSPLFLPETLQSLSWVHESDRILYCNVIIWLK